MTEYREIKKRLFYDGVEMASFYASYPACESEKIESFYVSAAERSLDWFVSQLFQDEKEAYISDTDKSKRFSHKPLKYLLRFEASYEDEKFLCVKQTVLLKRGNQEADKFCDSQIWSKADGLMLPSKTAVESIAPSSRKALKSRKLDAVSFEDNEIYILVGNEWQSIGDYVKDKK